MLAAGFKKLSFQSGMENTNFPGYLAELRFTGFQQSSSLPIVLARSETVLMRPDFDETEPSLAFVPADDEN